MQLPAGFVDRMDEFRELHGWSRRNLVATAITVLAQIMEAHEKYAAMHEDDIRELYMKLAAEMPAGFVEVPKDGSGSASSVTSRPCSSITGLSFPTARPATCSRRSREARAGSAASSTARSSR